MKLEQTGYVVPVVGGCMKTVQRIESWMVMDKSVFVHTGFISILRSNSTSNVPLFCMLYLI